MKIFKIPTLLLLLLLGMVAACEKKPGKITNPSWSSFEINDSFWTSGKGYSTIIGDSLMGFNFSAGRYIKEDDYFSTHSQMFIASIPTKVGKYALSSIPHNQFGDQSLSGQPFALFSTMMEAGEFYCTDYKVYAADSLNNWFQIERQEDNFRKVWGSYSITMIKDTSFLDGTCTRNTYGDTVRIRNARFYAEVAQ